MISGASRLTGNCRLCKADLRVRFPPGPLDKQKEKGYIMKVFIGNYNSNHDSVQLDLFTNEPVDRPDRNIQVQIDPWDTWSMDHTLAHIILPMLKQLRNTKHGSPNVDNTDVPEYLCSTDDKEDDKVHLKWDYVLDEMIFAFESKMEDWEEQFWLIKPKVDWHTFTNRQPDEDGFIPLPWLEEGHLDLEGYKAYQERISNGFRLFGVYFESLWD